MPEQKNNVEYFSAAQPGIKEEAFSVDVTTVLATINQKVSMAATESLDAVMNYIFDATREFFPCDRMSLAFLQEDSSLIQAYWTHTLYDDVKLQKGYAEDLSSTSLKYILESGQNRIIHDLEQYLKDHPYSLSSRLLVEEGVRSSLTCPLKIGDKIVGVFFRSSRKTHAYKPLQIQIHLAIADRLSLAVERAYRFEQMTKAIQEYREMLGFVSHELKSPMSSIVMDCDVLLNNYLGQLNQEQNRKIDRIQLKAKHLLGLVRDYLDLARMESGELKVNINSDVDFVKDVVDPCLEIARHSVERRVMEIKIDKPDYPIIVDCDPALFRTVLLNLLSNAIKYGYPVGEITIKMCLEDAKFVLSVKNDGFGFPPEQQMNLFKKFSRLRIPELFKQEGTGLGLYTVWRIVRLHQGMITAESKYKLWAEFIIEIPQ
ncbi:GAF domain-containing sensor histidine kinase [bacterium]|nr:GAF domain-containing sensor histidine kinase [candidate division CSSED10-310 bacterium]